MGEDERFSGVIFGAVDVVRGSCWTPACCNARSRWTSAFETPLAAWFMFSIAAQRLAKRRSNRNYTARLC